MDSTSFQISTNVRRAQPIVVPMRFAATNQAVTLVHVPSDTLWMLSVDAKTSTNASFIEDRYILLRAFTMGAWDVVKSLKYLSFKNLGLPRQFGMHEYDRFVSMRMQGRLQAARKRREGLHWHWRMLWNAWPLFTALHQLLGLVSVCLRNWLPFERKQSHVRRHRRMWSA